MYFLQVFLLTGGVSFGGLKMDSTETLLEGELSWKLVGKLPLAVYGIRVTNFHDVIYAFGNFKYFKEKG